MKPNAQVHHLFFFLSAVTFLFLQAAVVSIDFGDDSMKIAMIKIGKANDIILNTESKRKTPTALSIRSNERQFGSDSVNSASRFPSSTYLRLKSLIGKLYEDENVQAYKAFYGSPLVKDEVRGTVSFSHEHPQYGKFSVEELVAMILSYAKEQAEAVAKQKILDCIITVPVFFDEYERQALIDAADLAGLRVLELTNDLTAAAINFSTTRKFTETPVNYMLYDIGSSSTSASIISFSMTNVTDTANKTISHPLIDVLSVGHDRSLGGNSIDLRLQSHLVSQFEEKNPKLAGQVSANSRSLLKLLKEANRVKHVLSANQETNAMVDSLLGDTNFYAKVSRSQLETLCEDLLPKFFKPIEDSLKSANLTMVDIQSVLLVGGGARVPFILNALKSFVGEEKLSQNLNADESIAMGASFHGAALSKRFRVKEYIVKDPFNIKPSSKLNATEIQLKILPLTDEQKVECRNRIQTVNQDDLKRKDKARERNKLEQYLYSTKEHCTNPDYIKVSTEEERAFILQQADENLELLFEKGDEESIEFFQDLYKKFNGHESKISKKKHELLNRPRFVANLQNILSKVDKYAVETKAIPQEDRGQTDEELDGLIDTAKISSEWLAAKQEEQSVLAITDFPVFLCEDIGSRTKTLEQTLTRLQSKKKPYKAPPPPPPKNETVPEVPTESSEKTIPDVNQEGFSPKSNQTNAEAEDFMPVEEDLLPAEDIPKPGETDSDKSTQKIETEHPDL